ncbi:MAG: SusD/RagB family nutrient-binding outer membrane lipoprotein [Gemmatimonadota bacterium]
MPRSISLPGTTRFARLATVALCLGTAALAACDDFITGEGLTEDPNNPAAADALQLFVGVQASLMNQQEGQLPRIATMWTQQIAGTFNQQLNYGSQYILTEGDVDTFWNQSYAGGGLLDLRKLQGLARTANDNRLLGLALFIEAFRIGTVTSLWGDVPYSEAVNADNTAPKRDPQQEVYATVQAKLDSAITLLGATSGGPTAAADVFYEGNYARWIRAAYTLKARFHMHTVERLGQPAVTAALAAAQLGINEAPTSVAQALHNQAPGDFRPTHGNTFNDGNVWAQFQLGTRQDITAAQQFITLLQQRNDPRLAAYFDPAADGQYRGANQFGIAPAAGSSNLDRETRTVLTFRQPFITWAENQLIIAEAQFRLNNPGAALTATNAVRTSVGLPPLGSVTLEQIAEEKYVALYQNIEVYNDWKRNCWPRLTPGGANNTSATAIPARLPYALSERQANALNIPAPNAAPVRNWNDPNPCPAP